MMRLDQESDLVVDAADQRVKYVNREIDDRLADGALQMGMAM
jgi:benzoyl-CoA reductase/2-hydroxyglutaryl-CoA dehydratase subunit BcrC/BadD/HgdB